MNSILWLQYWKLERSYTETTNAETAEDDDKTLNLIYNHALTEFFISCFLLGESEPLCLKMLSIRGARS